MIDRFKMDKFQSLIVIWLVLMVNHITYSEHQSIKLTPPSVDQTATLTTTGYLDDNNQLLSTIGNNECGCLTNYEIKISNDALYTGQLIRCTKVKNFNHLNLITRLSLMTKCSQVEQQFNEIIISYNKFQHFNYSLLQNLNFTIKVDLSHNEIEQIDDSSFIGLTSLKHLDLSNNNLKQLNSNLFNGLISLVKLNLTGNQILNIDDFTFKPLNNLVILDLSLNHIVALRRNAFIGLNSLLQLNLASNYIQSLEEGVFDSIISRVRKIRLQNNNLICDCNLAWLIKAKERYNKNLIGKVMCSLAHHQPRIKLSSVQFENLVCANEVHLNKFDLNFKNNQTIEERTGQSFEFICEAIDGKQFESISFYRNDQLIAESTNYVNYLNDQFTNTSGLLNLKDLIEFKKSVINLNNFTMNSIKQKIIIHQLSKTDAGHYKCLIQTAFGNSSKKIELKIRTTNLTIYQQLYDQFKIVPSNSVMILNSLLLFVSILIYSTNFNSIEMNRRLKHIQLHLWIQLLILINLFYYSSTKNFSMIKLNCEFYGLFIYYLLVSIQFTILLSSIYLYKQLTKCTMTSLTNNKVSSLDKATNFTSFVNTNQHLVRANNNLPNPQSYNQQNYNDELISEQILMYQRQPSKSYCLKFVRFLFHHYTIRYHALNICLSTIVVLVFGLFNLNQFKTDSHCFPTILLVSNFYIFVPLLMLIIGQFCVLIIVRCAIKRFYRLHKKLEQRDTTVSLKEHVLEKHSMHVTNCLPCFRASSKLDMYWPASKHLLAQTINFLFYLLLLILIILTVVSQDKSIFKKSTLSNTYWWLPSSSSSSLVNDFRNGSISNHTKNELKNNQTNIQPSSIQLKDIYITTDQLPSDKLLDDQLLNSIYLFCTFLLCSHILIHYCLARKDIREALKSSFFKTFCLYACDCCCTKRTRCCANQTTSHKQIRSDRYANNCTTTLIPQQSRLLYSDHPQKSLYLQQQYSYPNKQQPLLFEEKDDDLYEQTDNDVQNGVSSQLTTLDGLDLLPNTNPSLNVLHKLSNVNEFRNDRNAFKTVQNTSHQDGTAMRLLNDHQMLSSESNSTTVTTGCSTINSFMCNEPLPLINSNFSNNQELRNYKIAPTKPFRTNIDSNKDHIYYETVNCATGTDQRYINQKYMDNFKASFDDTFLEGDNTNYLKSSKNEKAKSDIVVMNRGRKMRKLSMNNKQKPRCVEVKYHQHSQIGHLIMDSKNDHQKNSSILNPKLTHQFTFNQPINGNSISTANKAQITTRFEREFLTNQLKKYGSDTLDKIDYLPPVAKNSNCKSEIMTTMSQPVTFLGNSKIHSRPGRHALLKTSINNTKEANFENNLSYSFNTNFNQNQKVQQQQYNIKKNRSTTLNKSYLPTIQNRPLLICGPSNSFDETASDHLLNEQFKNDHCNNQTKENLYEKLNCKKFNRPTDDDKLIQIKNHQINLIEQQETEDDERYDNLDDCLANLNSNRMFLQNKGYENLPSRSLNNDNLSDLRNSPVLNLLDLRSSNSSRNSPNFINSSNLTNRSIKSNNSNRSIRSNLSNHSFNSKRSNVSSHKTNISRFSNEPNHTNDLVDKLNYNRSTTSNSSTNKTNEDDQFIEDHREKERKRTDQFNLILNRNANCQTNNYLNENLEFSSSD